MDIEITLDIDKEPYIKKITNNKIINLTGESGSGKSYYTDQFKNDSNYIIVDTDEVFNSKYDAQGINNELALMFEEKYGNDIPDVIHDFDTCYKDILSYFKDEERTIIIDSAQFRNIKDLSLLKGTIIIMRTCINTCFERCISRCANNNPNATNEEKEKYINKKKKMYDYYHSLNDFLIAIDKL